MRIIKWVLELCNELAEGLTQNGRTEILPNDSKESDDFKSKYFESVREELELLEQSE